MRMSNMNEKPVLIHREEFARRGCGGLSLYGLPAMMELLWHAAQEPDNSLPTDDDSLAALSTVGKKWYGKVSEEIRAWFEERDGRLYLKPNPVFRLDDPCGGRADG